MYLCWSELGEMERAGWDGGTWGSSLPARWTGAISAPETKLWQSCGAPEQIGFLRIQFGSQLFELKSMSALEPPRSLPWATDQGEQEEENFIVRIVPSAPELMWMESWGYRVTPDNLEYYDHQILVIGGDFADFPEHKKINLCWYFTHYPEMIPFVGVEHQLWISLCNVPATGFSEHVHLIQITWNTENHTRKNAKYPVLLCDQGFNTAPMNWLSSVKK